MTTQAVLHVGMPKCGSSALQAALSCTPELKGARYVVLDASGKLLHGAELARRVVTRPSGYLVSARSRQLAKLGIHELSRARRGLAELALSGSRLILSNEAWGNEHQEFRHGAILEKLDIECEVVVYVRPQVSWFNSAWWQWGAWTDAELEKWVDMQLPRVQWTQVAEAWRGVPGVSRLRLRLMPDRICDDFCRLLGMSGLPDVRANSSLPGSVLRLFQRQRQLRPRAHDSAIDFALARQLRELDSVTPWILPQELVGRILAACGPANEELSAYLDEGDRALMRDDQAWWSKAHYSDRRVEDWRAQPPDAEELDRLAADALAALFRLDADYRELMKSRRGKTMKQDNA